MYRIAVIPLALALLLPAAPLPAQSGSEPPRLRKPSRQTCSMLDQPRVRAKMDGVLTKLLLACGREHELGRVAQAPAIAAREPASLDVAVNDPGGDVDPRSHTQSETSIAWNPTTGTLCAGYNDSQHFAEGSGFTGFSRSVNGGESFTDQGALGAGSFGDPSVVWRRADGKFYFAALSSPGLGLWRSDDDCVSFSFVAAIHEGVGDDKELMAVDNDPTSPYAGRLYVVWTDFLANGRIHSTYSDDGGATWSAPVGISGEEGDVQGAWPVVAANGDVFVGWVRWNPFPDGPIDIEVVRSSDGGDTWSAASPPLVGGVNPRDAAATVTCGRPALGGNIRYLPSPQLAIGPDGVLHAVYAYDPDGFDTGDEIDVFYRRSSDSGASWDAEVRLNDDATVTDQFYPSISVSAENRVVTAWYDRRLDPAGNLLVDVFQRTSTDGGASFAASRRVSEVSSPIYLDPELATCYHGDYDSQVATADAAVLVWADDRNVQDGHNDPDVFSDRAPFTFLVSPAPRSLEVCAPAEAGYTLNVVAVEGFTEDVALAAQDVPAGLTPAFIPDPVAAPGTSELTVSGSGVVGAGDYTFGVIGTSSPSAVVQSATVSLGVVEVVPPAPAPAAPADGAADVELKPELSWPAVPTAASYRVEVSADAAFTNVVWSAATAAATAMVEIVLDPETEYFWRLEASNACGVGPSSAVFSFTTRAVPPVLVVDDDDDFPNVRGFYADTLDALGLEYDVWDTSNSDGEPGAAELGLYETVIWFTGDEFGGFAGPGADAEADLAAWLDAAEPGAVHRCLVLVSQDYHFDRGLTPFMETYLGVDAVIDDTISATVAGTGDVFAGLGPFALSVPFDDFSDVLSIGSDGETAFTGTEGDVAVTRTSHYRTMFFAFPFEGLPSAADREQVMARALGFCGPSIFSDGFESGDVAAWDARRP